MEQARTSDERGWRLHARDRDPAACWKREREALEAGEVLARVIRETIEAENATLLLRDEEDHREHVLTAGAGTASRRSSAKLAGGFRPDFGGLAVPVPPAQPIFVENTHASRCSGLTWWRLGR